MDQADSTAVKPPNGMALPKANGHAHGHAHTDSGIDLDFAAPHLFTPPKSTTTASSSIVGDPREQLLKDDLYSGLPTVGSKHPSPIAVCGIGLRLPGGISTPSQYWDLLVSGADASSPIPPSRFSSAGFSPSLGGKSHVKTPRGYFLTDDLAAFDPSLFSMTKSEVEKSDPYQRLLLEVTRECLEDAGETDYRGGLVGCYVGSFGDDWLQAFSRETQHSASYNIGATGDYMISNRVCYEYGFFGPSMVIKTACSSSLVALHEACRALHAGDATSAIVAGTNLLTGPDNFVLIGSEGILSPDGSCKSFDAGADGYARGEGITAVYVKKLEDALRDGNPVRAVIRATGTNHDGKSQGLFSPRAETQEMLMRKVYADAGLDPGETAFVECHGTGTATGDPIETTAVGNVFGERGVYIGSVKPNVGHTEGSAGLTSLIKGILTLENKTIPPNIKLTTPNPKIPWVEKKLVVPKVPTPFPADRAERVSINSFGIGGSNAHAILDSFPQTTTTSPRPQTTTPSTPRPELLVFSASTLPSLKNQILQHEHFAAAHPSKLTDMAYTRAIRRERLPQRGYRVVAADGQVLETSGAVKVSPHAGERPVTMIFSGQGAQWPGMGRELVRTDERFRHDLETMDGILKALSDPPGWTIAEELRKGSADSRIHTAELSQPLCTALQIALFHAYERLGVRPSEVVGHSSGEIAAAYAAGHVSLEHAITAAYYRGLVASRAASASTTLGTAVRGSMAALGLGASEVAAEFLVDGVVVACENSPESTTISGDAAEVDKVIARVAERRPGVLARALKVDMAYHSHHMTAIGQDYLSALESANSTMQIPPPSTRRKCTFYSTVTTHPITDSSAFTPAYWLSNLVSPVRFAPAVHSLLTHHGDSRLFLELGPHVALAGPLRQICTASSWTCNYVAAQARGADCAVSLLSSLGRLYQENAAGLDLRALFPREAKVVSGLPTYPWDHSGPSFWYESRLSREWRLRKHPHHVLLGVRTLESSDVEPAWRSVLALDDAPWLADHKVGRDVVFPFAGYVAMAGEAARQTTVDAEIGAGYALRRVVVRTALVLVEGRSVEMVTTLRRRRLTDADESEAWWEFGVVSFNGSVWIKHCEGEVRLLPSEGARVASWTPTDGGLVRRIQAPAFYDTMGKVGFVYGPEFQGLADVSAAASDYVAEAQVLNKHATSSPLFTLHPATIDACLQLLFVAISQGQLRRLDSLFVPTAIDEIEISRAGVEETLRGRATSPGKSAKEGTIECVDTASGKTVLRIAGLELTPLEKDEQVEDDDIHAAARLHWVPDFDFLPASSSTKLFIPPKTLRHHTALLQELTLHCILTHHALLSTTLTTPPPPHLSHLTHLHSWLSHQISRATSSTFTLVPNSSALVSLDPQARTSRIDALLSELLTGPEKALATGMKRVLDAAPQIHAGSQDVLSLLMADGILTQMYDHASFGNGPFVKALSRSRPALRILEVGAGTGGTTELVLRHLVGSGKGAPCYSTYTFTDVSAGFFAEAKERFAYAPNMSFLTFDVGRHPSSQPGIADQLGTYDVILAANVIHATPILKDTLSNLLPLLKGDGMLVMTEVSGDSGLAVGPGYVFGHFEGWWMGAEKDGRVLGPVVGVERWDRELMGAGFGGVERVVFDEEGEYAHMCVMVARPAAVEEKLPEKKEVRLLCGSSEPGSVAAGLKTFLEGKGWSVSCGGIGDIPSSSDSGVDIISCLDVDAHFFHDLSEQDFTAFKRFVEGLDPAQRVLWLLEPVQVNCRDPRSAQAIGALRTLRSEQGLGLYSLEIAKTAVNLGETVLGVFDKIRREHHLQQHQEGSAMGPDTEFVVDRDGTVLVPRYQPFRLPDDMLAQNLQQEEGKEEQNPRRSLHLSKTGALDTLHWRADPPPPLSIPADHIEMAPRAVGLNYRDVLLAAGLVPSHLSPTDPSDRPPLGCEASGTILRVGSAVRWLSPGDRVMAASVHGFLASSVVLPASYVRRIPNDVDFETAATMPVCSLTVLYSLFDVARLEKGQSVLIHSACGGVGLTAIQVCRMVGAEMYLTVGSDEKVRYLMEEYGIPRERIFHSRDDSFVEGVMRGTGGRGVDVVLNSLSGELLHETWRCVARFGCLVELGKRDFLGRARLDMGPFLENRSYHGVDLSQLTMYRPEKMQAVMGKFFEYYEQGLIKPLGYTAFDADHIGQAFRHLQSGSHIGKVIVTMPQPGDKPAATKTADLKPRKRAIEFDPNATYLLVGGAGGLGRSIATWMIEHGARHLTFLSRSAGQSPASTALLAELRSMGCSATAIAGAVDDMADVRRAIAEGSSPAHPIRGVLQLAMVLQDTSMAEMTHSQWTAVQRPKVNGTMNLHDALRDTDLDFFWLASSIIAATEGVGQGNYSAANTFLEAFCQHRHSLGLPASVLSIAPISGVGFVAENAHAERHIRQSGLYLLGEREFLDYLELSLLDGGKSDSDADGDDGDGGWCNRNQIVMGLRSELPLDDPNNRTRWRRLRRMGPFHNIKSSTSTTTSSSSPENSALRSFFQTLSSPSTSSTDRLALLSTKETLDLLAREIGRKIYDLMLKPSDEAVEPSLTLAQMGVDSLMAIELRRWFRSANGFGVKNLSVFEIMAAGSLEQLAELSAVKLREKVVQQQAGADGK